MRDLDADEGGAGLGVWSGRVAFFLDTVGFRLGFEADEAASSTSISSASEPMDGLNGLSSIVVFARFLRGLGAGLDMALTAEEMLGISASLTTVASSSSVLSSSSCAPGGRILVDFGVAGMAGTSGTSPSSVMGRFRLPLELVVLRASSLSAAFTERRGRLRIFLLEATEPSESEGGDGGGSKHRIIAHDVSLSSWMEESARNRARLMSVYQRMIRDARIRVWYEITHGMLALVAVTVWRAHVSISFNSLLAASVERLVRATDTLDGSTIVVVGDQAASVAVLHVEVGLVASNAVQLRGSCKLGEKGAESIDDFLGWRLLG